MPLKSVLNGAKLCQVLTKRTKQPCKNPAAYGSKSCRMHGAHKSRKVLRGVDHPQYRNGEETLEARAERNKKIVLFRYLIDLGKYCNVFPKELKPLGRPPANYEQPNLEDPEQLVETIKKTLNT